ncbi:MAG: ATP-binding cassette domain-containing protein [Desulfovibrionales bacterium]
MKLILQSLTKSYGARDLFRDLNVEVTPGMRLAIIGPNGCGKSTLLKGIAGESDFDAGKVILPGQARLGVVSQEISSQTLDRTLLTYVLEVVPSWGELWKEWESAGDAQAIEELTRRQEELERAFGYNPEHQAESILQGFGFSPKDFHRPMRVLSGGWRERAKLARALLAGPDVLLLDEPTNHLDLEAILWLEEYLRNYQGILLFVAHDRALLERVSTHILSLGEGKAVLRPGNLDAFLLWKNEREEQLKKRAEQLKDEINRKQAFVDRFKAKATKAAQARSRALSIRKLSWELGSLDTPAGRKTLSFSWPKPKNQSRVVAGAVDVSFAWPDGKTLFSKVNFNLIKGQKIALVGPNGAGKSTLLKLLTGELTPTSGRVSLGSLTEIGYFSQHQADTLREGSTVINEIRRFSHPHTTEEELRSVLGLFLIGEGYWERKVGELSGGEKNRLVLASLFLKRANFLVLDEPTNHLDLESREALVEALEEYSGTIMLVAHDRFLLSCLGAEIWRFTDAGIEEIHGGFDEYLQSLGREQAEPAEKSGEVPLENKSSQKAVRKKQAEVRNDFYRKIKPLREEFDRFEAKFDHNLAEQDEIERRLADPACHCDPDLLAELSREYRTRKEEGEHIMERLAILEKEIQDLERERDFLLGD